MVSVTYTKTHGLLGLEVAQARWREIASIPRFQM